MGFFDGLRRDRRAQAKQADIEIKQEAPKPEPKDEEVVEVSEPEEIVEDEMESIGEDGVVIERVETVDRNKPAVVDEDEEDDDDEQGPRPIKSYKDKKPVTHAIGQTKIIAIINQKGGVGKSTTAINLSAALGARGKQVLLVDLDPQGNTTSGFGIEKGRLEQCVYNVLLEDMSITDVIIPDVCEGVDLAPATINLAGAEVELVSQIAREARLKDSIGSLRGKYDYIFVDCPPSLGLLTVNALVAADKLLIPIQCEFYALEGVTKLLDSMKRVKTRLNPALDIFGILLTMYDSRTTLSKQVAAEVKNFFGRQVFETIIPRTVKLSEAPSYGMPITEYDPTCKGAQAYIELAEEVIKRG